MKSIIKMLSLLLGLSSLFFVTSCNKDDDSDDIEKVNIMLQFENQLAGHDAVSDHAHVAHDDTFLLNTVRYYISKVRLFDDVGNEIATFPDKYFLVKDSEENNFELGEIEIGKHVHRIVFNVGIDPETNNQTETDFNSYPAGHPLALQEGVKMHWAWNMGYIFVNIKGTVNSNNVELELGTDDLLREADVLLHENVMPGEHFHIHLVADIAAFFDGVDTESEVKAHTNNELAKKVMDNVPNVFSKAGGDGGHNHGKK
ncbi:MAG: MbnP family protein [Chitinophagales bacterium]